MGSEASILNYFANASVMVRLVLLLLLGASIVSWTVIIQRSLFFKQARQALRNFEAHLWSGIDIGRFYQELMQRGEPCTGLESIFIAGYREVARSHQAGFESSSVQMDSVQRVMRVAVNREQETLEQNLSWLATIGSISPYVGLFGTVFGIMTTFHHLGGAAQVTIAMVAPGIAEALVATAMGLFAAIPAVVAYNRLALEADSLAQHYVNFQDEFISLLTRRAPVQPSPTLDAVL